MPHPYLLLSTKIQLNDLSLGQAPAHVVLQAPPPTADPFHCTATPETQRWDGVRKNKALGASSSFCNPVSDQWYTRTRHCKDNFVKSTDITDWWWWLWWWCRQQCTCSMWAHDGDCNTINLTVRPENEGFSAQCSSQKLFPTTAF